MVRKIPTIYCFTSRLTTKTDVVKFVRYQFEKRVLAMRLACKKYLVYNILGHEWLNLQPMQVAPSCGQICNQFKWRHLVAKFGTNASGTIWWPNLELMQVAPSGGQI